MESRVRRVPGQAVVRIARRPGMTRVRRVTVPGSGPGGGFDGEHNDLDGRTEADAHPIEAITGLEERTVVRVEMILTDPTTFGGSYASDTWTIAAADGIAPDGSSIAVLGADADDMLGDVATGLFVHVGGGEFQRARSWSMEDAGRWVIAAVELAPDLGSDVAWLYHPNAGATVGYSFLQGGGGGGGGSVTWDDIVGRPLRFQPFVYAAHLGGETMDGVTDFLARDEDDLVIEEAGLHFGLEVYRPTSATIDGQSTVGQETVIALGSQATPANNGIWELFSDQLGITGDFCVRCREWNDPWRTDDRMLAGTTFFVANGVTYGRTIFHTLADGLDSGVAPTRQTATTVTVGALDGNLSAVSGGTVEDVVQAVDNLSLGGSIDTTVQLVTKVVGQLYGRPPGASLSTTTYFSGGNNAHFNLWQAPWDCTIDAIVFEQTGSTIDRSARVSVYAVDDDNRPSGAPLDSVVVAMTDGAAIYTVPLTTPMVLEAGDKVGLCLQGSSSLTLRMMAANNDAGVAPTSLTAAQALRDSTATWAGGAPNPPTVAAHTIQTPCIFARVSA